MAKTYTIKQKFTLNNTVGTRSIQFYGADSDVKAFIANLEGEITTKVEDSSLGRTGGDTVNISEATFVNKITATFDNQGDRTTKYISSFDGRAMVFKNTVSDDDIRASLVGASMLTSNTTAKPISVGVQMSGRIITAPSS